MLCCAQEENPDQETRVEGRRGSAGVEHTAEGFAVALVTWLPAAGGWAGSAGSSGWPLPSAPSSAEARASSASAFLQRLTAAGFHELPHVLEPLLHLVRPARAGALGLSRGPAARRHLTTPGLHELPQGLGSLVHLPRPARPGTLRGGAPGPAAMAHHRARTATAATHHRAGTSTAATHHRAGTTAAATHHRARTATAATHHRARTATATAHHRARATTTAAHRCPQPRWLWAVRRSRSPRP